MYEKFLAHDIHILSNQLERVADSISQGLDLTSVQFGILMYVLEAGKYKNVIQRDIEKTFDVRASTVSNAVKLLESKGVVKRTPSERDKRIKYLEVTEKGKDICNNLILDFIEYDRELRSSLTDDEYKILYTAMNKLFKICHEITEKYSRSNKQPIRDKS